MSKQSVGERLFDMAYYGVAILFIGAILLYSFYYAISEDVSLLHFWPLMLLKWGVEAGLLNPESARAIWEFFNPDILFLIGFACWFFIPTILGVLATILLMLALAIPIGLLILLWLGLKELVCREIASGIDRVNELRREKNDASSRDSRINDASSRDSRISRS